MSSSLALFEPGWLEPYPQLVDQTIEDTLVTGVRFDPRGLLCAGVCSNGTALVWDVDTWTVLRSLHGHAAAVTAASFSSTGRLLVTGGADWRCLVWDLATGEAMLSFDFDVPVTGVAVHPHKSHLILATLAKSAPVIINTEAQSMTLLPAAVPSDADPESLDVVAEWDPTGHYILTGTSKGHWRVLRMPTDIQSGSPAVDPPVYSEDLDAAVMHFALSPSGKNLAITVGDKSVRTYMLTYVLDGAANIKSPPPTFDVLKMFKLQDLVNRYTWCAAAWAGDEYVIAGAAKRTHLFNIWSQGTGTFVRILEGPSDPLVAFAWHPHWPLCVSVSQHGMVYIWNTAPKPRWSAFAPGFRELEDNIEYEEREDEFDQLVVEYERAREAKVRSQDAMPTKQPFLDLSDSSDRYAWTMAVPLEDGAGTERPHYSARPAVGLVQVEQSESDRKR